MSEKGKGDRKKPEKENAEIEIPKRECEPLELLEDLALSLKAEGRLKDFNEDKFLTRDRFWN